VNGKIAAAKSGGFSIQSLTPHFANTMLSAGNFRVT